MTEAETGPEQRVEVDFFAEQPEQGRKGKEAGEAEENNQKDEVAGPKWWAEEAGPEVIKDGS